jgi:hypothetical protein
MYLIGQLCGLAGTAITLVQPQFRKKFHILICTMLVNGLNALNFTFIGQFGVSVYLCLVAVFQALVMMWHNRKGSAVTRWENILFLLLYVGFGLYGMVSAPDFTWGLTWATALEVLPILGALMLMLSVFAPTEQKTRLLLLFNGSAWLVYTAVIGAAAFFTSVVAMISAGIALWKYRKTASKS